MWICRAWASSLIHCKRRTVRSVDTLDNGHKRNTQDLTRPNNRTSEVSPEDRTNSRTRKTKEEQCTNIYQLHLVHLRHVDREILEGGRVIEATTKTATELDSIAGSLWEAVTEHVVRAWRSYLDGSMHTVTLLFFFFTATPTRDLTLIFSLSLL